MNEVHYDKLIPDYGDLITVEEFRNTCENYNLIDYDGLGHPVRNGMMASKFEIKPSRVKDLPDDCTHIVWFNR